MIQLFQFQVNREKRGGLLATPGKYEREMSMNRPNSPSNIVMEIRMEVHGGDSGRIQNSKNGGLQQTIQQLNISQQVV